MLAEMFPALLLTNERVELSAYGLMEYNVGKPKLWLLKLDQRLEIATGLSKGYRDIRTA